MYKLKQDSINRIFVLALASALMVSGCSLGESSETGKDGIEWESVGGEAAEDLNSSENAESSQTEEAAPTETYQTVTAGTPEEAGFNTNTLKLIDDMMEVQMDYGFSGAQLAVIKDGKLVVDKAWGVTNGYVAPQIDSEGNILSDAYVDKSSAPITSDTMFDLASNTKMFATNFAVQKLVYDGKLDIHKRVCEYIPEFKDREGDDQIKGKTEIKVSDLLSHQAGFPADPCYHNNDAAMIKQYPDLFCQDRNEILSKIIDTPLKYEPGTEREYSDVDYMILGFIVEKITGKRLDEYVKEEFYDKMGLTHMTFNPLENGFSKEDCAATELNGNTRQGRFIYDNVRRETVWGEVHDEKAYYCMDGVSGHAGLFGSARELAKLCQVMINGGGWGEEQFFDQSTIDMFTAPVDPETLDWGLGWWLKDSNDNPGRTNYFGLESSIGTFGHTGWTGTITLIDPDKKLIIVYLASTKNSPVINRMKNGNDFVGNNVSMGSLGLTPNLIYEALNSNNDASIDALLVEMVNQRIRSLDPHYDKYDEWPHVTDAVAWVETLLRRAEERKNSVLKDGGIKAAETLLLRAEEKATHPKSLDALRQKLPGLIDRFKSLEASDFTPIYGEFEVLPTNISTWNDYENKPRVSFPSPRGDTVMANMVAQCTTCYDVAEGYGQFAVRVLKPEKIGSLRIFVNGYEVDCSQIKDNPTEEYMIDISKVSRNGFNIIQVTGLDIFSEEPEEIVEIVYG
ncbi:MAG: penicillin binding protein PBP4B [Lachnospiraceae bacterium]|jgi:CubicO group peptidase (beta-lactamase class C family)|nr:penicillin binding protein PBP4B [Lachnospiraceae bacterium]